MGLLYEWILSNELDISSCPFVLPIFISHQSNAVDCFATVCRQICLTECFGKSLQIDELNPRGKTICMATGCGWQTRAMSSQEAPYSSARVASATISPAF